MYLYYPLVRTLLSVFDCDFSGIGVVRRAQSVPCWSTDEPLHIVLATAASIAILCYYPLSTALYPLLQARACA